MKKVVLAYSGGLDTSVILKWIKVRVHPKTKITEQKIQIYVKKATNLSLSIDFDRFMQTQLRMPSLNETT